MEMASTSLPPPLLHHAPVHTFQCYFSAGIADETGGVQLNLHRSGLLNDSFCCLKSTDDSSRTVSFFYEVLTLRYLEEREAELCLREWGFELQLARLLSQTGSCCFTFCCLLCFASVGFDRQIKATRLNNRTSITNCTRYHKKRKKKHCAGVYHIFILSNKNRFNAYKQMIFPLLLLQPRYLVAVT